jgi:membrane-associated two-gene conflict system component 1 (EACC1)
LVEATKGFNFSMAVQLQLTCDSEADAESLFRWLRDEPGARADGRLARAENDDPEELGPLIDVLTLVIGSGFSAAQLVLAVKQWRESRPRPPELVVTHVHPDGSTTRIEASTPEALETALRELERA